MKFYSRRWTWILYGLAFLFLAGGAVAALLIWQARSSSTQEFLDPSAAGDVAIAVLDNTASIAEDWMAPDLPNDLASLTIKQQESLALLAGEVERTEELTAEVEGGRVDEDRESLQNLLEALVLISRAQVSLERGLGELGNLLATLQPLDAAEAAYTRGRETLFAAVESHNHAAASGSTSFGTAIQEASSAAAALQESLASLETVKLEGLDLGAGTSTVAGLESTAQRFVEACRRGESNDVEGHNSLMAEVQEELSASPASILASIDLSTWLRPDVEGFIQPVLEELAEARDLLIG
ncbi:MAG: hypothetical protein C4536_16250 [Actinobacteria bacterium]|jgi:hypothetical protein|nr:MAG: hypothetical protein C4536_16250 [Actinomycetota bacterium]